MACVDKMPKINEESEMEEGEIVDELDDLSDISSEEEFLLRQRLEVLENYNTVLERKKAKRSSMGPGTKQKRHILCDLSEISATELEDPHTHGLYKNLRVQRHVKPHKEKRKKELPYVDENNLRRKKDNQKKRTSRKKKLDVKATSESSDESEDEYRNKRKKLANAVIVHKAADKSSLSARLHKMIHWSEAHIHPISNDKNTDTIVPNNHINLIEALSPISSVNADDPISVDVTDSVLKDKNKTICESIEVSTDDDVKIINEVESEEKDKTEDIKVQEDAKEFQVQVEKDSDEDLELLRQHALKSKPMKSITPKPSKIEQKPLSEDEDSDTAELRLICLKSALLKKAIEMKQKQKMQKKLSQSSNLEDDLLNDDDLFSIKEDGNNTDIESVDMDMGSDAEEKTKDWNENEKKNNIRFDDSDIKNDLINCAINNITSAAKEDELDDDEDLLRAKLLTSLSKNLTNLVNPEVLKLNDEVKVENETPQTAAAANTPEAKKFIIKLDESDSEGEHEATKNLTKMHMKLSEQIDFQQKLDQFLKSTRMEVEKSKLPDVVQKPPVPKKPNKFVAKAVNNLPKSEQIEYKNLVRRMAELEKMKQTRQATLSLLNQQQAKDTLKLRNVTIDTKAITSNNLEELIAKSRKKIAEESVKILKMKEEGTKLSQRYKIATTEVRNINTAIILNKKHLRNHQVRLSKMRLEHQSLLKSSTPLHSNINGRVPQLSNLSNKALSNKSLKENNPKDEYKNVFVQKALKVSVVNDFVADTTITNPRLSVELDVTSNKKVVKIPNKDADSDITNDTVSTEPDEQIEEQNKRLLETDSDINKAPEQEESTESTKDMELIAVCDHGNKRYYISVDDYKSPLDALGSTTYIDCGTHATSTKCCHLKLEATEQRKRTTATCGGRHKCWQADPNAILCPFEVGGQCKDPDCNYLHTPVPAQ